MPEVLVPLVVLVPFVEVLPMLSEVLFVPQALNKTTNNESSETESSPVKVCRIPPSKDVRMLKHLDSRTPVV